MNEKQVDKYNDNFHFQQGTKCIFVIWILMHYVDKTVAILHDSKKYEVNKINVDNDNYYFV